MQTNIVVSVDENIDSLFTAVFELFGRTDIAAVTSRAEVQMSLCSEHITLSADAEKAGRIRTAARRLLGDFGMQEVFDAYRSGHGSREKVIFDYLTMLFKEGKNSVKNLARAEVVAFKEILERVRHESHLMRGFVRFMRAQSGIYYAEIAPDNNVLDMVMPFFCRRFNDMRFVVHDSRRGLLGIYDGKRHSVVKSSLPVQALIGEDERNLQRLFKQYYRSISIPERKNLRLMRRFMPVRYHRYMPEKDELL